MTAVLTSTRWGPMLVPPYDIYLSQAMIRLREYAPAEFETWRPYLHAGGVALDIGANFGAHTFALADAVGPRGRVLAFEPQWALYAMLCGSAQLIGARQVRPHHCAVGDLQGTILVPPIDYSKQANFGGLELGAHQEGTFVPLRSIDGFDLDDVDFVKIDVEGMELDVLRGAEQTLARCRPVLCVEADREPLVPALIEWLRAHDYRLWWHRPLLGAPWPNIVSVNLMCLPAERQDLPDPAGDVEAIA